MTPGRVSFAFIHPGHQSHCFAQSKQRLMMFDAMESGRMLHGKGEMSKECGSNGIVAGRNTLTKALLDESDAEWLFMVDADMGFAHDALERLIASADPVERPVVGALCFALKSDDAHDMLARTAYARRYRMTPTIYDFIEDDGRVGWLARMNYERDALTQCGATGAACTLVHRRVLEAIRAKYGDTWFDPITHPKGPTTFGEDMSFCVRVAACDFPLWVDTSIKTTHDKGGVFLDEHTFDLQERDRRVFA